MRIFRTGALFCLVLTIVVPATHAFNYDSYKRGNLDDLLELPRPESGMDVTAFKKLNVTVTLESYAEKRCGTAGLVKMIMTMLPDMYPKRLLESVSMAKCIKVKSDKGSTVTVAIQDKVADFLPKEVPLGTKMQVYCILMGVSENGPAILVNEFQTPDGKE